MFTPQDLITALQTLTGRRFAYLTGRGASAEFLTLRALSLLTGVRQVIVPDLICRVVLDAAVLAGMDIVLADIEPKRLAPSTAIIPSFLTHSQPPPIMIYTHLFGLIVSDSSYHNLITKQTLSRYFLIEDAVQGIGAPGVGSTGQVSFLSFAESKPLKGRGGAILTDDPALWEAIHAAERLPLPPPPVHPRFTVYYAQLISAREDYLFPFRADSESIGRTLDSIRTLPAETRLRTEQALWIADQLRSIDWLTLPQISAEDAIWRVPLIINTPLQARKVLIALRQAGFRASDNYTPLSHVFDPGSTRFSTTVARRMVNLFVPDSWARLREIVGIIQRLTA
jgi:dTDP-4-amino-4,6-dideoxygalactose transaminase